MGVKKKNETSNKKKDPKAWPNLPPNLLNQIRRKPKLFDNITAFGCVTKSWRSPTDKCSRQPRGPQLVEINNSGGGGGGGGGGDDHHKMAVEFRDFNYEIYHDWPRARKEYRPTLLAPPGVHFKGHSHGALLVMAANMTDCYLWRPSSYWNTTPLAPWNYPNIPFNLCATSKDRSQVMVVTGSSSPAFAVHVSTHGWIFGDCNMKEPYDPRKKMQLSNAIGMEGKFYGLSLQGSLVVIERETAECSSSFTVTAIGGNRAVPRKASKLFREYLFECDGEIMLVFLVSRESIDVVDEVEVYRLDAGQLLWVDMAGIGERALFLEEECCMGVCAREVGCRSNCVYFTHLGREDWLVFDMETAKISEAPQRNLCNVE